MFSFSAYFASVEQNQPELGTRQHRRDNETMLHTKTFLLIALHAWLYSFWLLHLNTKAHLSTFCSSLKAITYCHVDVVAKLRNCRIPSSGISSCICACWVLACYNFLAGGCRWQHGQSGSLHTYNSSLCGTQTACDRHSNSFPPWGWSYCSRVGNSLFGFRANRFIRVKERFTLI